MSTKRGEIFGDPNSDKISGNAAKELLNIVAIWRLEEAEEALGKNITNLRNGNHVIRRFLAH